MTVTEAKLERSSRLDTSDIMWLLAGQIRESRQAAEAQFAWLQSQVNGDFTEKQLHRLAELRGSIESALTRTETKLMSQLSEFADRVETHLTAVGTSIDSAVTAVAGLTNDVANLKKQITDLQNSPGAITPEDQARLNTIESTATGLSNRVASVADALAQLDAQTENVPVPDPTPS